MSDAKPAAGQSTHAMSLPSAGSAAQPLRVYFAGRWGRREELRIRRDAFQSFGVVVTSSWLDEAPHANVPDDGSELPASPATRAEIATRDLNDLASSDVIVAFTEDPRSPYGRGGRHVELGVALGLRKLVWIVGPRENVFCWLPQVRQFDDFDGLLAWYWGRMGGWGRDHRFAWGGGLEWKGPSESEKAGGHWVSSEELLAAHRRHFDHPAGPAERKVLERAAAEEAAHRAKLNAVWMDRLATGSD